MKLTDIFIKRPVLASVVSLMILALGLRSMSQLPIREFPYIVNAVVTVTTAYVGADPELIAGFISTTLENSIAESEGIDYLTSTSTQSTSTIEAHLKINYDVNKALTEINTKVNAVLNYLPKEAQQPALSVEVGETIDSMYIGFYSDVLPDNKITDYILRVVQPKLQTVDGVQKAEILGGRDFSMRAWLDPRKMAGFGVTALDVSKALAENDFISAVGRTDGDMIAVNLTAKTGLHTVDEFKKMVVKAENGAIIRLQDVANVSLGAENYDSIFRFDGEAAVYIGIKLAPGANILTTLDKVRKIFPAIHNQLPQGLEGKIVYDASQYVDTAIHEVEQSLTEAIIIVTIVIFLFLGTIRSVVIPVIAIPLSLIGTFFIMFLLGYSINLLTLLALVLAIGLVVDDAIIVVENIYRHMEEGMPRMQAAIQGARELANPIIAISVVLIAVYVPIGFMTGLTGALFTEFAFTLAGAVGISAIIALTLSPMMCSKLLKSAHTHSDKQNQSRSFVVWIDNQFEKIQKFYEKKLSLTLDYLPVALVFALMILISIYFLYSYSEHELAPQEDQGIIIASLTGAPNASLRQMELYTKEVYKILAQHEETAHVFQADGTEGLNSGIAGMVLKPWNERKQTSNDLQPIVQTELGNIAGINAAVFQPPSLPGSFDLPVQFIIITTESFDKLNEVSEEFLDRIKESGIFSYIDTDLKMNKLQETIVIDRDKTALMGLTMADVGGVLASSLGGNYINFFDLSGRSYRVIAQVAREFRLNPEDLLQYYIVPTSTNTSIPLSTIATLKKEVVPESLNHFQQLNSSTFSGTTVSGVTLGEALNRMQTIANEILPEGYDVDYAGQSRQFIQESAALLLTFLFAMIIIFLTLAALFESFRDPLIVLISVPMSICGALIFICLGVGGASLNIYTEVGLVTLIGLISKHGILIVQFANDLQRAGKTLREAIELAASIRLRPILMTTGSMVLGVLPLILSTGAGAVSRFNIGLVIASGIAIGTLFTLFVVPAMYMLLAERIEKESTENENDSLKKGSTEIV